MAKERSKNFGSRAKQFLLSLTQIICSVWFWFFVVTIIYIPIVVYNIFRLHYTQAFWWNDFYNISSNFLVGSIISFLFYFLVVSLPEHRKRHIIKNYLKSIYIDIKEDILVQIIFASQKGGRDDLAADHETIDKLLTIEGFRSAFRNGREANEGFYAFCNHISDDVPEYRSIVFSLKVLSKQIDYVLHNYNINDPRIFNFFKRLEVFLMRLESIGPGYDESKILTRFIWEIYAGWNYIEGETGYDIINKMIEDI